MSGIRIPPAMPPAGFNLNTAVANFEEEKTFFGPMFVVIAPPIRRRLKKNRTQSDRDKSCLGRVIRRFRTGKALMRNTSRYCHDEDIDEDFDDIEDDIISWGP